MQICVRVYFGKREIIWLTDACVVVTCTRNVPCAQPLLLHKRHCPLPFDGKANLAPVPSTSGDQGSGRAADPEEGAQGENEGVPLGAEVRRS